ncbi:hypothetical protein GCK72_003320 [Caenorhabditis remanei]|uniref:Uncharacterized protein n=1 Tax=Caenorhabditis remanei TaxID=31234 RepID=A0A6A5HY16_CAERE|nr:hypothetical protein GCK72_003320 [Caenorhabditis remanei]KAF1771493.1 hypothetical protein GCK72_003320 [Caenorhabditis remanei]
MSVTSLSSGSASFDLSVSLFEAFDFTPMQLAFQLNAQQQKRRNSSLNLFLAEDYLSLMQKKELRRLPKVEGNSWKCFSGETIKKERPLKEERPIKMERPDQFPVVKLTIFEVDSVTTHYFDV